MFSSGHTFIYDKKHEVTVPHSWFNHTNEEYQRAPNRFRIRARCESLKAEALESGYLTLAKWKRMVHLKGTQYLKLKKTRKMIAVNIPYMISDLEEGDPISLQHLISIILYCDFSQLCTDFSGTYRKEHVFESLESMTKRHSHWWWLGRLLKESVHYFGTDGETDPGPFFCGVNVKLNFSLGGMILYGPCSTSKARAVAVNFARRYGVLLEVNNDGNYYGPKIRHFNCSWISNYAEESECLFLAEKYPVRIVNIATIETGKSYRRMSTVFFILKALLSGWRLTKDLFSMDQTDNYEMFNAFLSQRRNSGVVEHLDSYIFGMFDWFCKSTRDIVINIWEKFDFHGFF